MDNQGSHPVADNHPVVGNQGTRQEGDSLDKRLAGHQDRPSPCNLLIPVPQAGSVQGPLGR